MSNRVIAVQTAQSCVEIVKCISGMSLDIHCAPGSRYDVLIEHYAGSIDCVMRLDRDSSATIVFVGKSITTSEVTCSVIGYGVGARAVIIGAYDIQESHSLSLKTEQHHTAPHTTSSLHVRKIVRDNAFSHYNGMIHLTSDAAHADASQKDITLLVGDHARAESVPSIEVRTHDVKCAHGSAIGRLDAQQVHYMQVRGLNEQDAQTLLLNGFFSAVLDTIECGELRAHALAYLGIDYEQSSR